MTLGNRLKKLLFAVFAISGLLWLSGCGGKKGTGVNTNSTPPNEKTEAPEKTAPSQPQILVSSEDEYEKLPEQEKEKYEQPEKKIKIKTKTKEIEIHRGQSQFSDVVYVGDKSDVKITGRFQLKDVEDVSNDDVFKFELRGKVENNSPTITIASYDVDKRTSSRIRLGARVTCLSYDEKNQIDCSLAVVDFYIQVKETHLKDQYRPFRPKKAQAPPPEPLPPVVETPPPAEENPDKPQPPVEAKDVAGTKEGKEDSLNGVFNTQVDLEDDIEEIFKDEKKADTPVPQSVEPKKEKPKVNKDGLLITSQGILRPVNQAVNLPDEGSLLRATDLALQQRQLKEEELYNIVHPTRKKYFATFEMGQLISRLGLFARRKFAKPFAVGNLSLSKGGESPPHASHQNGTDGDFGYLTDDPDVWFPSVASGGRLNPSVYNPVKNLELLEKAFKMTDIQVDRIFMDQAIIDDLCKVAKREQFFNPSSSDPKWKEKNEFWKNVFRNIQHVDGHGDHMHIRIKCSPQDRACVSKIYRKVENCQN